MSGRVTALEPQRRSRDRVNVYLDGEFAFGLARAAAVNLSVGVWLSDEQIARLRADDELERARAKALDFLSYRSRSAEEVREYLERKHFRSDIIEDIMARLRGVGLIDDQAFAQYWVDNRTRFRPRGARLLRHELRQKKVAPEAIEAALEAYDERTALMLAAEQQARRLRHLPEEQFRRRLFQRLARRGFSYELIQEALADCDLPYTHREQSEED